jgi:hypothetical protein
MMRTTLNLPEDVYELARALATSKRISIGEAVAELIRGGLRPRPQVQEDGTGFPCFSVSSNAAPITLEHTLEIEDEP